MGNEKENGAKVELGVFPGLGDAVKELAKPMYEDGLKPAVVQVGKTLETATRLVNALLMPLSVGIYAVEQIKPVLEEGVAKRLTAWGTKEEDARTPPPHVVVPAIEALRYTASVEELREMFLNLIASSMDASRAEAVHPSFVEILKQISPDEGRILSLFFDQKALSQWWIEVKRHVPPDGKRGGRFETDGTFARLSLVAKDAGCAVPAMVPAYVENLLRQGLVYEPRPWASQVETVEDLGNSREDPHLPGFFYAGERVGELYRQHPEIEEIVRGFRDKSDHLEVWHGEFRLTEFGKAFCRACVGGEDPKGLLAFGAQGEKLVNYRIRV